MPVTLDRETAHKLAVYANPSDRSKEPKTRLQMAAKLVRAGLLTRRVPVHIFRVAWLPFPHAQAWLGALNGQYLCDYLDSCER